MSRLTVSRSILGPALFVVVVLLLDKYATGLQITDLRVPPSVQNGSGSAAILDCQYTLRPDELTAESGLVVKWFFNNGPAPVYQWIPRQKPQDLGILRGKLKLDYNASHHHATMHRALYIVNPTTELTGEYKCFVSTFADEDFMIKRMIVYAPEKRLEIVQSKPGLETVNISCTAEGVFPEPKMFLFKDSDRKERRPMSGVKIETTSRGGVYDITASTIINDQDLTAPTMFSCELLIPQTTYTNHKYIVYYPGQALPWTDNGAGSRCAGLSITSWLLASSLWAVLHW